MPISLSLFAGAGWQFFDNNGVILSGGKLYTYAAGTSTPLTTYTSSSGSSSNTNPIYLDSAGRVPYEIWVSTATSAKFILRDANNVLIGTWDNIPSYASSLNLTGVNNAVAYFNNVGTFTSNSNMTFDGTNLTVAGGITAGSNVAITGDISTTGTATFAGTLSATGGITSSTTAVTQASNDNSTKIATTAFVQNATAKDKIQPINVSNVTSGGFTISLDPTTIDFRNTTSNSGTVTTISNSSAVSISLTGAATLGTTSGTQARIVVLAIYNSTIAAMELAVVNLAGGNQLDETNILSSTTAITSGTSASVVYSTTARTNVAYRVVGFVDAINTAGSWSTPTLVQGIGGQALNGIQAFSRADNGYVTLPSGIIIKWGKVSGSVGTGASIVFPVAFPNSCFNVTASWEGSPGGHVVFTSSSAASGFSYSWNYWSSIGAGNPGYLCYIAVGY